MPLDNEVSHESVLPAVAAALPCRACDRRAHHGLSLSRMIYLLSV
jgi:hypothetical protein